MRIVATADLHGHLPEIPICDLLLIAGDICPAWDHDRKFQAKWLRSDFAEWMMATPAEEIVWVGGNHDFVLEDMDRAKIDKLPGYYLNNEPVKTCGLKVWGSPMSATFGRWAFMRDDSALSEVWHQIPADVDILMVHGPAYGYGDGVPYMTMVRDDKGVHYWEPASVEHVGSKTLRNRLDYSNYPNLKAFISGHIHESFGNGKTEAKGISWYNVSHMDGRYNPVNPPLVIDL